MFDDEEQDSINALQRTIDNEDLTSGKKPGAISIDPALLEAQKVSEKKPAAISIDPALIVAQEEYENRNTNPFRIDPENLVAQAISQVGYTEKDDSQYNDDDVTDASHAGKGNHTKFGVYTNSDGDYWCASFVSWLINEDNQSSTFEKSASTGYIMDEYGNDYHANDHSTPPHAGDIVIFNTPGKKVEHDDGTVTYGLDHCHIGIVVAYDPETGQVYTVEGNTSGVAGSGGCVNYHSYDLYDIYPEGTETGKYYMQGFCSNGGTSYGTITDDMQKSSPTVTIH